MKKLMIAAAIVCAAALSQAATVSWASGTLKDTGLPGATGASVKQQEFYVYEIVSIPDGMTAAQRYAAYGDDMTKVYADKANLGSAIASGKTNNTGKNTVTTGDATGWAAGSTHYIAVITEKEVNGDTYYIANTLVAKVGESDNTTTLLNIATNLHGADGTALTWQSVPEPTSGLLLLLGVAGLALRRRRA